MHLVSSLPDELVQAQLARIIDSRQFRNAPRLSRFLTFVVTQCLAGRSDCLKGYTIGLEVFDKDDDFDPQTDTIVRVQARALRQKLDQYYRQDGANDPVRLVIAKGGYQPEFYLNPVSEDAGETKEDPAIEKTPPVVPMSGRPSIAVLPFECIGLGEDCDFLALGLTEGVISDLSRFKYFSVFSKSTTQEAKKQNLSIPQMFQRFHPDFVLEGTFRIRNELIETRIKLIDAAADSVMMTYKIDMRMDPDHIYDVQDEISIRIAARIGVDGPIGSFAQHAQRSRPSIKWETYAQLSRYFEYGLLLSQADRDDIEAGLKHAVTVDPMSAEAYAALAMIEVERFRTMSDQLGDPEVLAQALQNAKRAVRLDPQSAMAHQSLALAYFHSHRFIDFRVAVRRALDLNPGHGDMLATFGLCFVRRAEWDAGIPLLERALWLNPMHPDWYHMPKAMYLMMTKGPEDAIAEFTKRPMPGVFSFHFLLLWFYVEAGDMDAARTERNRLLDVAPDTEQFARRYFNAICLCDEIADRAIAAVRKVGLNIV